MHIVNLFPGSFGSNCYLIEDSGHALIVDPSAAASSILKRLQNDGCVPDAILLTHGHFDHIMSVDTLRDAVPGLKVYIHEADAPMLTDGDKNGFSFFFHRERIWRAADEHLYDGQILTVGNTRLEVIHTPGHSPGSVCFLCAEAGILLTGDTLFADNIGRYDLWQASFHALHASIQALGALNGALTIYPGHGDTESLSHALNCALGFFRSYHAH